jgi:hypothetical protein
VVDLPPSTKSFPGPEISSDERFRAVVRHLDSISRAEISRLEVLALSQLIHEFLISALHFQNQGRRFASDPGDHRQQRQPLQELKRLRKAAKRQDLKKVQMIMGDLSPECLTLITASDAYPVLELSDNELLIKSLDRAINDPKMYRRPERKELDRAVACLVGTYERLTGDQAKLANDVMSGRPISKIHQFVLQIGRIYELPLVSPASDDRIEKVLEPTFKYETTFPSAWSDSLGWA